MDYMQAALGHSLQHKLADDRHEPSIWTNSLLVPVYCACVSVVVLVLGAAFAARRTKHVHTRSQDAPSCDVADRKPVDGSIGGLKSLWEQFSNHGKRTNHAFVLVRLLVCLSLTCLFIAAAVLRKGHNDSWLGIGQPEWIQLALALTSAYTTFLAVASVFARTSAHHRVTVHLGLLLVVLFCVHVYRDVWPLATFELRPKDSKEGWILSGKLTLLTVGAIFIPLFMPRQYVPVDTKEPMANPSPEQTCSWASLLFYSFMDSTILRAYRLPHLPYDELPPLADYDHAKNLIKRSYPHLDTFSGAKKQHMFRGLVAIFYKDYIVLAILQIFMVFSSFARPLGINGILRYLETRGEDMVVKPWFWIIWLFLGPLIGTLSIQYYALLNTGTLIRCEAIVTQLIFDHALRIRLTAEGSASPPRPAEALDAMTPEVASGSRSAGSNTPRATVETSGSRAAGSTQGSGFSTKKPGAKQDNVKSVDATKARVDASPKAVNLVGKINNLVTTDLANLVDGRDFLYLAFYAPLQFASCMYYLYYFLGWSSFVGLAVMLLLFPLPGLLAKRIQTVQVQCMKKTDARVQTVTETMNVLRMIKLFGWERKVNGQVEEKREEELRLLWKRKLLELASNNLNYVLPLMQMISTYLTFTVIMKKPLSASLVFSTISIFNVLRGQLSSVLDHIPRYIKAKVSLDRVDAFLSETELLDQFNEKTPVFETISGSVDNDMCKIGFRDATFAWSNDDGALSPSRRNFRLRIEQELVFKRGGINLIIGPTGSGKTSLLMALLGEMHFERQSTGSWFNLPREDGIAYAAQESWVQNETIQNNILFGAPYEEERYNKVVYQCALERDLALFIAGDQTEVGEKGLTLSGGQKARVTLARAVYSSAEIILFDDVLAALDVHTSRWIVDKCFQGDLIRGRTILLVTHNVALASSIADFVVSLGADGRVHSQLSVSDALATDNALVKEFQAEKEAIDEAEKEVDAENPTRAAQVDAAKDPRGKLIAAEEVSEGHVGWPAVKMYLLSQGGGWPVPFWGIMLSAFVASELSNTTQTWFLGYWARQYDMKDPSEVNVGYYLSGYAGLLGFAVLMNAAYFTMFVFGQLRASRLLHRRLVESVLGTTLRWLDTTPTARIMARCTQDIRAVDGSVSGSLSKLISQTISMSMKLAAVVLFTPIFVIPGVFMAIVGGYCGQIYIKAQLSVKREMSVARTPVLGHFGAAMAGLVSIRAYGAQTAFKNESLRRIDRYTRAARAFYNINRWVNVRLDILGSLFASGLASYLIYGRTLPTAADTGFSLTMAVGFSGMILWWVRVLNVFEVSGISLERIKAYTSIEQEPKATEGGIPPAYWPVSGDLRVENLSARYSPDGPTILHDVSFHIKSGERVGIVGRTGSGKSSLTLSLLRCIFTEGEMYYDGIPTSSLNLDALRSSVTIIPQSPELLSGTLRQNLDPFAQHDDPTLYDALRSAGLFSVQSTAGERQLDLDTPVSSGGSNLSVGQRQILALARAIVRQSKLLILDEATSAIDYKTDDVIQTSLRRELKKDVTVITVAHRLQTVMDADRIMVLDAGRIIEFDSPKELLKKEKGLLKALVEDSGEKDMLYSIVKRES